MRDYLRRYALPAFILVVGVLMVMNGFYIDIGIGHHERARAEADGAPDIKVVTRDSIVRDTIYIDRPVPVDVHHVRTEYITVRDTVRIPVPIEQKHYKDSLYDAWVSGYRAQLDSIRIKETTRYIYQDRIITPKPKRPRVVISAGIYGGIGIRSPDVGVGIGIGIPLWYW